MSGEVLRAGFGVFGLYFAEGLGLFRSVGLVFFFCFFIFGLYGSCKFFFELSFVFVFV